MLPTLTIVPLQHDLFGWIVWIQKNVREKPCIVVDEKTTLRVLDEVLPATFAASAMRFLATENRVLRLAHKLKIGHSSPIGHRIHTLRQRIVDPYKLRQFHRRRLGICRDLELRLLRTEFRHQL